MIDKRPLPKGMTIISAAFLDDRQARPSYTQLWYYISDNIEIGRLMSAFVCFIQKDLANLYFYYKKKQINLGKTCAEVCFANDFKEDPYINISSLNSERVQF